MKTFAAVLQNDANYIFCYSSTSHSAGNTSAAIASEKGVLQGVEGLSSAQRREKVLLVK